MKNKSCYRQKKKKCRWRELNPGQFKIIAKSNKTEGMVAGSGLI